MKKSKFTEGQIVFALMQSEQGVTVEEIIRKMGISEATFYNWKKKYGGLGLSELRELRMLKDENSRIKKMVADLSLDKQMLQDVLKKSLKAVTTEGFILLSKATVWFFITSTLFCANDTSFGILLSTPSKGKFGAQGPGQVNCCSKDTIWPLADLYPTPT